MKILYYECFAGLSGDMNLGAMIDLGVPEQHLRDALNNLHVEGYELIIEKTLKSGIAGTKVTVQLHDGDTHPPHRHLSDINNIIDNSPLPVNVRDTAKAIFLELAKAEAKIHNKSVESIHFHEVGAVDAMVDIVGAAICYHYLGVDHVYASEIELGKGFVECAHGTFPVPAPATLEILHDVPVTKGRVSGESTTPTGAAILKVLVNEFVTSVAFTPSRTAYGIGHKEFEVPNVVRVSLGEAAHTGAFLENMLLLETNVDDADGEKTGYAMQQCLDAGAVDVYTIPLGMKKNRPGQMLCVLCHHQDKSTMARILFTETGTLGIREQLVNRQVLRRENVHFTSSLGDVSIKISYFGNRVVRIKPEYDDCTRLAGQHGLPLREVQERVLSEYKQR